MQEQFWFLKSCDLLSSLSDEQIALIERRSQIRKFPARNPVYLPSEAADSVFLVASGVVKICHISLDGKPSTLAFVKSGEVFGELALLDADDRGEYVETIEATTLVRIPKSAIESLMNSNLNIALQITKFVGLRRQRIEQRLRNLLFASNQQRLCHLLLDLADQFGIVVDSGIKLGLKLSHQEMANLIGATRETVTLLLGKMKSDGLLQLQRQTVILKNITRLSELAGRS